MASARSARDANNDGAPTCDHVAPRSFGGARNVAEHNHQITASWAAYLGSPGDI